MNQDLPVNRPEVFGDADSSDATDHATRINTLTAVAPVSYTHLTLPTKA